MADNQPSSAVPEGTRPAIDVPPLEREEFQDLGAIDGEPNSDVKIRTTSGLELRERVVEVAANADSALHDAAAPTARTIVISNALLKLDGSVATDQEGRPYLSSRHEVVLTNEAMGRLATPEALETAMRDAREIAAAKAAVEFRGVQLHEQLLGGRLRTVEQ